MGTSYIEYEGYGFWSRDSCIESWLRTLITEMRSNAAPEDWQKALIDDWLIQIEIDGGAMTLDLDKHLSEPSKLEALISRSSSALQKADPDGRRTGELFLELLRGRLKTKVSSPIDYL